MKKLFTLLLILSLSLKDNINCQAYQEDQITCHCSNGDNIEASVKEDCIRLCQNKGGVRSFTPGISGGISSKKTK